MGSSERLAVFHPECLDDLRHWVENDRKIARRILRLVEAALRDPTAGIGKPEPLKHLGPGLWSRRITREHRLVYLVREDRVDFLQARYPQLGLFPPPPASFERDEAEASSDG